MLVDKQGVLNAPRAADAAEFAPADTHGTISERLVRFSLDLDWDDLPDAVAEKVKLLILDTVGVCIGSARLPSGAAMLRQCSEWSGAGPCTLIGSGSRVMAQYAAFGNGALGHAQDYDDTHTESIVHPSCVLVPAVLAAAERSGSTGRDLAATLAAVTESVIRLALPAGGAINRRGFQASSSLGAFGSALIAARLAGFDHEQSVQAIGIAGSFSSGLMECVPASASSKQFQPGWGGFCGIMAADLARAGFTGPRTVFEGSLGYFAAFLHGIPVSAADVFRGLGEVWELLNVRPKLYPCAHNIHAAIECAAALRRTGVQPHEIEAVLCEPPPGAVPMVCEPWSRKVAPQTGYDARFSLPYVIAVMLVTGRAGIDSYTDELANDGVIRGIMARTSYRVNPAFQFRDMPGRVSITLNDGSVRTHEVPSVRGNATNPIGQAELLAKFEANTAHLGHERSRRIADMILNIERLPGLQLLMAAISPPVR